MVITIGKILLMAIMPFFMHATHVHMTARGIQGEPLKTATIGHPFTLDIAITDFHGATAQYPTIKGLEQFQISTSGYQMRTIHGNTEISFKYQVRIDQPGTFILGPAEFTDGQQSIQSNQLHVTVTQDQAAQESHQKNKKDDHTFLRLHCNKKNAVVDEKVKCSLRFYNADRSQLQHIHEPDQNECNNYRIQNKTGPFAGTQMIEGVLYNYVEWKWQLYPKKEGVCLIPAYSADYIPASSQQNFFFGFMQMSRTKRTYSNTIALKIAAMPAHNEKIDAVGTFTQLHASINPSTAKISEGMVLTIALTGDADFDNLAFSLKNMPDVCKWYDSKAYIQPSKSNEDFATKYFEYIIQPLSAGQCEIPSQEFIFFDPKTFSYKKLQTTPLTIQVIGNLPAAVSNNALASLQTSIATDNEYKNDIRPLLLDEPGAPFGQALPLFWFLVLVFGALFIWFVFVCKEYLGHYLSLLTFGKKDAFQVAFLQLKEAEKNHNYAALYSIFVNLFSHKLQCTPNELTQEMMVNALFSAGASEKLIEDWNGFFTKISEYVFYTHQKQTASGDQLFKKAFIWIHTLQELL